MTSSKPNPFLISAGLFTLLLTLVILLISSYVKQENSPYAWDFSNYEHQTEGLSDQLRISFNHAGEKIEESLATDYNVLPCLPILAIYRLLGQSRLAFILACGLIYLVPYALTMGALAARLFPEKRSVSFWLSAYLTLAVAPTWFSLLRGYPDMGAAVLMNLAVLMFLADLKIKTWRRAFIMGALLAFAVIFRRHFAYCVRGALVTMGLSLAVNFVRSLPKHKIASLASVFREFFLLFLTAFFCFGCMWLIAPQFTEGILHTDYRTLYRSYEYPTLTVLHQYGMLYGAGLILLSSAGLILSLRLKMQGKARVIFMNSLAAVLILQWLFIGKQYGLHYTLHFHFICILGMTGWILRLLSLPQKRVRMISLFGSILFLTANLLVALTPQGKLHDPLSFLFSQNEPPLIRRDISETQRLVNFLRDKLPFKAPIFVIGASWKFSYQFIYETERALYTKEESWLRLLVAPAVDSRDFYPLEGLLQAEYVILAVPVQLHHSAEREQVVKFPYDLFVEHQEFAQDFVRLPHEFQFDDGVKIWIFKRFRPTSLAVALRTFKSMSARIQGRPAWQTDWMVLENKNHANIFKKGRGPLRIVLTDFDKGSFLYFGTIPKKLLLSGHFQAESPLHLCRETRVALRALNSEGETINEAAGAVSWVRNKKNPLELSLDSGRAEYLRMDVQNDGVCSLSLLELSVSEAPAKESL